MHQWVNYLNRSYMELYGAKIKLFKLDKVATKKHELYIEEAQTGRLYLPPVEMRSLHDDNKWRGSLGLDLYHESEQPLVLYVNFEDMVQKLTEARRRHIANLYIKYLGQGIPTIQKKNNVLTVWAGKQILLQYDLNDRAYSTVKKLASHIHSFDDFECELEGENDLSRNILEFEKTSFSGRQVLIYSEDTAYKNVTDVIEMGDAILTNKYRLYEVQDVAPAGEFGWEYTTWKIECKLAPIDNFNLPGDYIEQIKRNEYGLRTKIKME